MSDSTDEENKKAGRGPGKIGARVKHNLTETFNRIGGLDAMAQWAAENRTEFYRMWAKLLPVQMKHSGKLNHDHAHVHSSVSATAAWVESVAGERAEGAPPKPLSH